MYAALLGLLGSPHIDPETACMNLLSSVEFTQDIILRVTWVRPKAVSRGSFENRGKAKSTRDSAAPSLRGAGIGYLVSETKTEVRFIPDIRE
jgi:hypothetical protein